MTAYDAAAPEGGDESLTDRGPSRSLLVALLAVVALPLAAQQTLDRTKVPAPGKPPELRVPAWTKSHARQRRRADRLGEARPAARLVLDHLPRRRRSVRAGRHAAASRSLTAAMLSEGTRHANGEALSNALQLLGDERVGERRRRVRRDRLRVDDREVRADARHPRRHAAATRRFPADALERLRGAAAGRADAGAGRSPARSPAASSRACSTAPRIRTASR